MSKRADFKDNTLPNEKNLAKPHSSESLAIDSLESFQIEEKDPTIFGDWQHKGKVTDF